MPLHLAEIHVFPVKGCAGMTPHRAAAERCGLAGDRRWMVVDGTGRMLTQRVAPGLTLVAATVAADGLTLEMAGQGALLVALPGAGAARMAVTVWRDTVDAAAAGPAADAWLSAALGVPCRLVRMDDPRARPCRGGDALAGETVSFADGFPVLLTSLGSLADLNARLARPVPMSRFRGNLVVAGAAAWAEDNWRMVRIGGAVFRVAKPCDRCIVTTIDQATGERPEPAEPLRTLGMFRRAQAGIMFGQNLVPLECGRMALGDAVEVLECGEPNVVPVG